MKARNPLAPPGKSLDYIHSKTAYYKSFFLESWDECFGKTFGLVCPFFVFKSVADLENLFNARIQRYAILIFCIIGIDSI